MDSVQWLEGSVGGPRKRGRYRPKEDRLSIERRVETESRDWTAREVLRPYCTKLLESLVETSSRRYC